MPSFHYTALNRDNKNLGGIIEAPDEQSARKKLNEMELSVISLNLADDKQHVQQTGKTVFEFEAIDKNNKKVAGTITSDDIIKAFARLFDEYQLNVIYLAPSHATESEKQEIRKNGLLPVQQEYERLYAKKSKKISSEEAEAIKKEEQRKELIQKVDSTMKRIEIFLKQYSADLKSEERDAIQSYLNQLMRIKDSTNLEHIRNTCEKMLAHIQKQELFINEEQKSKESAQVKAETHEMLSDLKRGRLSKEINISELPFFKPIANFIANFIRPKNPEAEKTENEIKTTGKHIWSYIKIIISAKSKLERAAAWEGIKTMFAEKRRLKLKLHAIKEEEEKVSSGQQTRETSAFWESAGSTLGWILAFYLFSYIASYPFTIKSFGSLALPKGFYFYHSTFAKSATMFLFIAYATIAVRNFWLKNHANAAYLLYPVSIFAFLLIIINLM